MLVCVPLAYMISTFDGSGFLSWVGICCSSIVIKRAAFGRPVIRYINERRIKYHIQPLSSKEIKESMFEPVAIPKLSLSSIISNLIRVPQRAPGALCVLMISATWKIIDYQSMT
jgi:hypothetical protein